MRGRGESGLYRLVLRARSLISSFSLRVISFLSSAVCSEGRRKVRHTRILRSIALEGEAAKVEPARPSSTTNATSLPTILQTCIIPPQFDETRFRISLVSVPGLSLNGF